MKDLITILIKDLLIKKASQKYMTSKQMVVKPKSFEEVAADLKNKQKDKKWNLN